MATRLEIQHGLINERDRLSTSADTVSVTRPSTGSKTRSKGVLFIVVGSAIPGPRAREATKLVAETIRHEYYYDESAGVPVCLEKAIKAADRRLRSSREGAGLPPGSLGVAPIGSCTGSMNRPTLFRSCESITGRASTDHAETHAPTVSCLC